VRDLDGTVHFIPHGHIEVTSNLTRGFSRIYFVVAVPNSADIERVFQLIDDAGAELTAEDVSGGSIREAPHAEGIERMGDTMVEVRVTGVAEPGEQWRVTAAMRRRLKAAFDAAGITLRDPAV
jgi:small conductance mechanosensitive channel